MTTKDRTQTPASPARGAGSRGVLSEFERLLREPGCPACRYLAEAERSFFSWLRIESFSVAEVQARLRAGMGMCEVHSRRLVEEFGEGHVMTIIVREAIAGARQRLREDGEPGPCPACDAVGFGSQRARQLVVDGLADPATARVYSDHDGVCLAHFLQAARERRRVDPQTDGGTAAGELACARRVGVGRAAGGRGPGRRSPRPLAGRVAPGVGRRLDGRGTVRSPRFRGLSRVPVRRAGRARLHSVVPRAHRGRRSVARQRSGRAVPRASPRSGPCRSTAGRRRDRAQASDPGGAARAPAVAPGGVASAWEERAAERRRARRRARGGRHRAVLPGV